MAGNKHDLSVQSDLEKITLPAAITDRIESIAKNVHDEWTRKKLAEGWKYGPFYDNKNKIHPSLVPYDELPESEKEYDRLTAITALKITVSLGFKIS